MSELRKDCTNRGRLNKEPAVCRRPSVKTMLCGIYRDAKTTSISSESFGQITVRQT